MSVREELNAPQLQAVAHEAGPLLVFAGAGSGKTRVITYRIANLLAQHGVAPYRILAVTFTNKAAGEMKHRLEALAGPEMAQDLWVGTFHSVCARLLRRYADEVGLEKNYVIYDQSDQKAMLTRVIRNMGLDERSYLPKTVLNRIHEKKREAVGPDDIEVDYRIDETFVDVYRAYEAQLKKANAVDFEDLIVHVMRVAESDTPAGRELRDRYQYVLVDEFQDTNAIQYRLVSALARQHRNLFVVGDDDQSIYSWRGADIRNIRGFQRDFPEARVVKLEQNYRSTRNIVAAALGVIEHSPGREPKKLWTEANAGPPVALRELQDEREEASQVVAGVKQAMRAGVPADQIAVFYRINAQSRVLEEALRRERIAYQVVGGVKFFERAEVKDLLAYLRLVDNPRSDADLLRIINTPTRGIGKKTVETLLSTALKRDSSAYDALEPVISGGSLGTGAKKKLAAFRDLIEELRAAAKTAYPSSLAEQVLKRSGYRDQLVRDDTAESDARLENLAELIGAIGEYEEESQGDEMPSLQGYLERVSLIADIDQVRDEPNVLLMTIHSAKGLEFDSVFLTGMEEEVFPYRGLDADHADELDEERRLCYVAITRARHQLTISYVNVRTLFGHTRYLLPSRFLRDIPEAVLDAPLLARRNARGGDWLGTNVTELPSRKPEMSDERIVDYDAFDDIGHDDEYSAAQQLRRGARVSHRRFGQGTVESVISGDTPMVVARFPGYGTRKVLARFLSF